MKPQVRCVLHDESSTFSYMVWDPETRRAAVIDPALDFDQHSGRTGTETARGLVDLVREHDLTVDWVLETHAHADHVSAAPYIRDQVGGRIAIGEGIRAVQSHFREVFNLERRNATTVGEQRHGNIHVHEGVEEEAYVRMRTERDATLDLPRLILPSVQLNIRAGELPPPEAGDKRYIKSPIDAL